MATRIPFPAALFSDPIPDLTVDQLRRELREFTPPLPATGLKPVLQSRLQLANLGYRWADKEGEIATWLKMDKASIKKKAAELGVGDVEGKTIKVLARECVMRAVGLNENDQAPNPPLVAEEAGKQPFASGQAVNQPQPIAQAATPVQQYYAVPTQQQLTKFAPVQHHTPMMQPAVASSSSAPNTQQPIVNAPVQQHRTNTPAAHHQTGNSNFSGSSSDSALPAAFKPTNQQQQFDTTFDTTLPSTIDVNFHPGQQSIYAGAAIIPSADTTKVNHVPSSSTKDAQAHVTSTSTANTNNRSSNDTKAHTQTQAAQGQAGQGHGTQAPTTTQAQTQVGAFDNADTIYRLKHVQYIINGPDIERIRPDDAVYLATLVKGFYRAFFELVDGLR